MYRESQHYLAFIRFPTLWRLLYVYVQVVCICTGTCTRIYGFKINDLESTDVMAAQVPFLAFQSTSTRRLQPKRKKQRQQQNISSIDKQPKEDSFWRMTGDTSRSPELSPGTSGLRLAGCRPAIPLLPCLAACPPCPLSASALCFATLCALRPCLSCTALLCLALPPPSSALPVLPYLFTCLSCCFVPRCSALSCPALLSPPW